MRTALRDKKALSSEIRKKKRATNGIPKIISVYGTQAFDIADNHITVTIPFAFEPSMNQTSYDGLSTTHSKVLKIIKNNHSLRIEDIAKLAGLGKTRTNQIITDLKNPGKIERVGGNKKGYWEVK